MATMLVEGAEICRRNDGDKNSETFHNLRIFTETASLQDLAGTQAGSTPPRPAASTPCRSDAGRVNRKGIPTRFRGSTASARREAVPLQRHPVAGFSRLLPAKRLLHRPPRVRRLPGVAVLEPATWWETPCRVDPPAHRGRGLAAATGPFARRRLGRCGAWRRGQPPRPPQTADLGFRRVPGIPSRLSRGWCGKRPRRPQGQLP